MMHEAYKPKIQTQFQKAYSQERELHKDFLIKEGLLKKTAYRAARKPSGDTLSRLISNKLREDRKVRNSYDSRTMNFIERKKAMHCQHTHNDDKTGKAA